MDIRLRLVYADMLRGRMRWRSRKVEVGGLGLLAGCGSAEWNVVCSRMFACSWGLLALPFPASGCPALALFYEFIFIALTSHQPSVHIDMILYAVLIYPPKRGWSDLDVQAFIRQ